MKKALSRAGTSTPPVTAASEKSQKMSRFVICVAVAIFATIFTAVPAASAAEPIKTITAGAGLTGGGGGPTVTLAVANGGITNAMLANPSLGVLAGPGLFGGGSVALGGSTTLGIADGGVTPAKLNATGSSVGDVLTSDGTNAFWRSLPPTNAWSLSGNAGTSPATNFLGTTDNQPVVLKVNGNRALRLEPGDNPSLSSSPNLIGGFSGNGVGAGVSGATISGGGGGSTNSVSADFGVVGGGTGNTAGGLSSSVAGGQSNSASGDWASVAGGNSNVASGTSSSITGGGSNIASGDVSSVAGGSANTASGFASFAAGLHANATHDGSFVWADDHLANFSSTADNEFSARAVGGVRFVSGFDSSGNQTGVSLAPGSGSWSSMSDRAMKRNFVRVDGSVILQRIAGLPISSWSYKAQKASVRHLGPTAQDFARAFGLGEDNRHIDTIDSEGVALAGIQTLYKLELRQQRELNQQQREIRALQRELRTSRR